MLGQKFGLVTLCCTALDWVCVAWFLQQVSYRAIPVRPWATLCQKCFFPVGSTKHPLQDTAEPISQVCGASENTFKKGKKCQQCEGVKKGETTVKISGLEKELRKGCSRHQRRQ